MFLLSFDVLGQKRYIENIQAVIPQTARVQFFCFTTLVSGFALVARGYSCVIPSTDSAVSIGAKDH